MTIEQLVGDATKMESMTDAELLEFFGPCLNFVRPQRKPVEVTKSVGAKPSKSRREQIQALLDMVPD